MQEVLQNSVGIPQEASIYHRKDRYTIGKIDIPQQLSNSSKKIVFSNADYGKCSFEMKNESFDTFQRSINIAVKRLSKDNLSFPGWWIKAFGVGSPGKPSKNLHAVGGFPSHV